MIQVIKVSRATDGKFLFSIEANLDRDDINKIKKRILKKLEVAGYKEEAVQNKMRLFTIRGVEVY